MNIALSRGAGSALTVSASAGAAEGVCVSVAVSVPSLSPSWNESVTSLRLPADLPAGHYVLGWRYDCEATAQVWQNCADVYLRS